MSLVQLEEGNEHDGGDQPMWIHTADEIEFEFGRLEIYLAKKNKNIG